MSETKVTTADLKGLAGGLRAVFWYQPAAHVDPADRLPLALAAAENIAANADVLNEYQKVAEAEGRRLSEMLDSAAAAYDKVDAVSKAAIDDPQRRVMIEAIALDPPQTPLPAMPETPSTPKALDADGFSAIEQTQGLLLAGSDASLRAAAVQWGLAADSAEGGRPPQNNTDWEGDAADAAHRRLNEYGEWLTELSAAWRRLADVANKVADAHVTAVAEHHAVYARYVALKKVLAELIAAGGPQELVKAQHLQAELAELQRQSDEVRRDYAGSATFDPVRVPEPDFAAQRGSTVAGTPGGGGGRTGGGGGTTSRPTSSTTSPSMSAGPLSASQSPSPPGGGESPGGAGGGPPSGKGGTPAGSGGGTPPGAGNAGGALDTGLPDLTPAGDDPGISPASTGMAGGSGGGAGGGGGAPAMPLQPSVSAETVAPGPGGARGGGSGAIPTSAMSGGMGGAGAGMGGMGHGGGGHQGKDKQRDPKLAPDEDLYVEDRPWTEGVIGARRRRDTADQE